MAAKRARVAMTFGIFSAEASVAVISPPATPEADSDMEQGFTPRDFSGTASGYAHERGAKTYAHRSGRAADKG